MRATIPRLALDEALRLCLLSSDARGTMPILADVLLRPEAGSLALCSTDLNLSTIVKIDCDATGPAVAVNAKRMHDAVKGMSGDEVRTEWNETAKRLVLRCGRGRYEIPTDPAQDFPRLFGAKEGGQAVPGGLLRDLLETAAHAMGQDPTRTNIEGCMLAGDGVSLVCVGTDGHRLCKASTPSPFKTRVHLPLGGVRMLRSTLPAADVEIATDGAWLFVRSGNTEQAIKLLDTSAFPPWEQVIPKDADAWVKVQRGPALRAVRSVIASAAQDNKACGTALHFGLECLIVEARGERGDAVEAVDLARVSGDPASIKANGKYFADVLDAAPEEIEIGISGHLDPMLLRAPGLTAVIMPMREWDRAGYHWKGEE